MTHTHPRATRDERRRVNLGLQCPECHGVSVEECADPHARRFCCADCGCQWSMGYYKEGGRETQTP